MYRMLPVNAAPPLSPLSLSDICICLALKRVNQLARVRLAAAAVGSCNLKPAKSRQRSIEL